jgi:type IV pilus assembly protein PilW
MRLVSRNWHQTRGFTVVELMIATVIAAILMLGVIQIFSANKRSHVIGTGLARVQENLRFAMKDIAYAGRMAGYVGCSGKIKNHLDTTDPGYSDDLFNFDHATGGWEFTNGAGTSVTEPGQSYTLPSSINPDGTASHWDNYNDDDLPASLTSKVLPGTDVVVLKWAGNNTGININNMNINNAAINTVGSSGIAQGAILVVSDCSGGDAFQNAANASGATVSRGTVAGWSPGNANPGTAKWSHLYPGGADFLYFISRAFYIGEGASGEPALYRITYAQGATGQVVEELAEGIENMQVLYGIDTNSDKYADQFVTARDVTSHADVVALKFAFLARTPDEIKETASSNTYNLLGTTITSPSDRRLRYVFTSTLKLRNKGVK